MKKQTQKKDNKKRRKALLAAFIPVGTIAVASAITLPLVLVKKGGETPVEKTTVHLDFNDNITEIKDCEVVKGKPMSQPTAPTRLNCVFLGWYEEKPASSTEMWDENKKFNFETKIDDEKTLYARWGNEFNNIDWQTATSAIKTFEDATATVETAQKLCLALGVDASQTQKTTAKEVLEENLVGVVGTVRMNGVFHYIRCIGAMHDKDTNDKLVALTFQLENVLSFCAEDNSIYAISCPWFDRSTQIGNKNFITNAIVHTNLNDDTEAEKTWIYLKNWGQETIIKKSCISMLKDEENGTPLVESAIKTTKHNVATTTTDWTTGVTADTNYSCKLFIPNYFNLTSNRATEGTYCQETPANNPVYKYYSDSATETTRRIKTRMNGDATTFWIASPYTDNFRNVHLITSGGTFAYYVGSSMNAELSFAFCI